MTDREAMKQALEALEEACGDRCNAEYNPCHARTAITSLRQAIEQAEKQEPVAWNSGVPPLYPEIKDGETISVEYVEATPPAQRQWVGLTPTDMEELSSEWWTPNENEMALINWIEAKLKEKNHG
jgi:hypothetical protein